MYQHLQPTIAEERTLCGGMIFQQSKTQWALFLCYRSFSRAFLCKKEITNGTKYQTTPNYLQFQNRSYICQQGFIKFGNDCVRLTWKKTGETAICRIAETKFLYQLNATKNLQLFGNIAQTIPIVIPMIFIN